MVEQMMRDTQFKDRTNEELLVEYKATNQLEIKQELALRYLYIVRSVAVQMRDVYVGFTQLDDIVHEGVIALMGALDKFDIDKNVKFETFIAKRIRGMVIDIARKQDWVPRTVRKSAKEINEASMAIYAETGQTPGSKAIAERLKISEDKFQEIMGKTNLFSVLSLDAILQETNERQRAVQMPSAVKSEQPEEYYLQCEFKELLQESIQSLKQNEQMVISLYYVEELNMKEIAQVLEVSEPRISQIHANAIRKLKQYIEIQMQNSAGKKG